MENQEKLNQTIERLKAIRQYVDSICEVWDNPQYVTISVIIGNMTCDLMEASENKDNTYKYLDVLEKLSTLNPDCHVSAHIYSEVFGIFYRFYGFKEGGQPHLVKNNFNKHLRPVNER